MLLSFEQKFENHKIRRNIHVRFHKKKPTKIPKTTIQTNTNHFKHHSHSLVYTQTTNTHQSRTNNRFRALPPPQLTDRFSSRISFEERTPSRCALGCQDVSEGGLDDPGTPRLSQCFLCNYLRLVLVRSHPRSRLRLHRAPSGMCVALLRFGGLFLKYDLVFAYF